jgi:hypothetical protein
MQHLIKKTDVGKLLYQAMIVFMRLILAAYHPSLSCRLVDYSFPSVDIHAHLQQLYGCGVMVNQKN